MSEHYNKETVHYSIPEKCCAMCIHSYFSSMDDTCCYILNAPNVIDMGGVCDQYMEGADE